MKISINCNINSVHQWKNKLQLHKINNFFFFLKNKFSGEVYESLFDIKDLFWSAVNVVF